MKAEEGDELLDRQAGLANQRPQRSFVGRRNEDGGMRTAGIRDGGWFGVSDIGQESRQHRCNRHNLR